MDQRDGSIGWTSTCLIGGGWLLRITGLNSLVTVMVCSQPQVVFFGGSKVVLWILHSHSNGCPLDCVDILPCDGANRDPGGFRDSLDGIMVDVAWVSKF